MFTALTIYGNAIFEFFVAFNMIMSPWELLGGHRPAAGFETLSLEWFGVSCGLYGLSLLMYQRQALTFATIYNFVWVAMLAMVFTNQPWRSESAVTDGSWALVPMAAHVVFGITALLSMGEGEGGEKSKHQ